MAASVSLHTSAGRGPATALHLRDALAVLVEDARAVDFRPFETLPTRDFAPALVDRMEALLRRAVLLVERVYERHSEDEFEPEFEPSASSLRESGTTVASPSCERVADLCFVALLELGSQERPLASVATAADAWLVLSTCSTVKQKLVKSACAVERALCAHEGLQSLLATTIETELQISLQVRHAYHCFRKELLKHGAPESDTIVNRLRQAGVSIARLVGRDVYEHLRTGDRMQLRWFQNQLLDWLRGDGDRVPRAGMRLWQDLAALAGVLISVNNRADLRNHDLAVVAEVERALADDAFSGDVVPPEFRRRLQAIEGRDDELDHLLASSPSVSVAACRVVLARLRDQLGFVSSPLEDTLNLSAEAEVPETK